MSKSQQLRARDVRRLYWLLGECQDLGADSRAWRLHMMNELCRLVGSPIGISAQIVGASGPTPQICHSADLGWPGDLERRVWVQHLTEEGLRGDPVYCVVLGRLLAQREMATLTRRQAIADREWYRSQHYNERRKVGRVDHCIYSFRFLPEQGPDVVNAIALDRTTGEPAFDERERKLIDVFHRELGPLIGRQLAAPSEPSAMNLPLRLRQVLLCLLEGDGEKQIAYRLGLSRPTVHQYVTALYRHFGVQSRSELLAHWIRLH